MKNLEQYVLDEKFEVNTNESIETVNEEKVNTYQGKKAKIKWAVDEPEDNDAANDIDLDSEENTESLKELIAKFDTEEPFFIQGKAGWGKTAVVKKLAKKYDKKVLTVYLDKAEAVDLGGIPVPVSGEADIVANAKDLATGKVKKTKFAKQMKAMPPWASEMLEHPDTDYLLFFDEMNQAQPDVMNALMPIVLENVICEIQFDNFFVGAAGNFEYENQGAISELSEPLQERFDPLIEWEDNTPRAWKEKFNYLHSKWDKVISKELVDKFEENASLFKSPRIIEHKIFQFVHRLKASGVTRHKASLFLTRLKKLTKKKPSEYTRTEEKTVTKLAESIYDFIVGNTSTEDSKKKTKDSQQVPEEIKKGIKSGMEDGYFELMIEDENGRERRIRFGVSKENISSIVNEEECNAEMLERIIRRFENEGITWKYEKNQDWKKLKLEDPTDDKWSLTLSSKSKIVPNRKPQVKND